MSDDTMKKRVEELFGVELEKNDVVQDIFAQLDPSPRPKIEPAPIPPTGLPSGFDVEHLVEKIEHLQGMVCDINAVVAEHTRNINKLMACPRL